MFQPNITCRLYGADMYHTEWNLTFLDVDNRKLHPSQLNNAEITALNLNITNFM